MGKDSKVGDLQEVVACVMECSPHGPSSGSIPFSREGSACSLRGLKDALLGTSWRPYPHVPDKETDGQREWVCPGLNWHVWSPAGLGLNSGSSHSPAL